MAKRGTQETVTWLTYPGHETLDRVGWMGTLYRLRDTSPEAWLAALERSMQEPGFWDDREHARGISEAHAALHHSLSSS